MESAAGGLRRSERGCGETDAMRWRSSGSLIGLFLVAWLAAVPAAVEGQVQVIQEGGEDFNNIFLPAPRGLRQQLARAERALEEEQYGVAVDLLGQLLADAGWEGATAEGGSQQDYFLSDSEGSGTRVSLKAQAQRLLGSMPEPGRELYELKFGADARQLLDRALRAGDFHQLVEVTRRYFHTRAGYESTLLLGRHQLDRGQPLAAAMRFQRLEGNRVAEQLYEPELSLLLAACWHLAGMPERAEATLLSLKARLPRAVVRIGDTDMSLFADDQQALEWLEQLIGAGFVAQRGGASEWVLYRGDPARNAQSAGGFPLLNARWRVRVANHPSDEEMIGQQLRQYLDQGVPALPGLHPLALAEVVVMRTPRRLIAVDLETGKRIWEFPWFEAPDEVALQNDRIRPDRQFADPQTLELSRRVWDDAPYGQMSSDGRHVFLLWGLGADARQPSVRIQNLGLQVPNPLGTSGANKLVALDVQAQGKLKWIAGDVDGTDEPKLAGAFFLGAPLPLMGQLYVLAEINSEIRLVVLDAETGRLDWSQQLAHVDVRDIASDPIRRAAGASPSFSDGVLICPTSAGAVVAVDISTRSLLWGYQYPQGSRPMRQGISIYPYAAKQVGERWSDATVTIADGRVVLTPAESDQLYCLDLVTGVPVWEPQPRNQLLFTGCVREGRVVLVGADQVQALSLADGKQLWSTPLPSGMPSGRGIVTADSYYLPTVAGQLLQIDLASGAITQVIHTETVLGNLVAYRDQIISQNVDWLTTYYQTEPLREIVARRLREAENDVWALTRQGELFLYDGRHAEAVDVFRRAHRLDPSDDAVRGSLVQALLAALEQDFATYRPLAEELEPLMDQPAQQAEFHRLMAVGFQRQGEVNRAVEFFVKLAAVDFAADSGGDHEREGLMRVDPQLRIRRDRWIRVHTAELFADADDSARTQIDATVSGHLDEIVRRESIAGLTRFIDHFGDHPLGQRARLQLAEMLVARERLLEAQQHLVDLQSADDGPLAATATLRLARLLENLGYLREAEACYQRLATQWAEVTTLDGLTGREVAAAAGWGDSSDSQARDQTVWPYGKCVVTEETLATPNAAYLSVFPIELTDSQGPFPRETSFVYDRQRNAVFMRDRHGKTVQQILLGEASRFLPSSPSLPAGSAEAKGHFVLLHVGTEVIAVDTLREGSARGEVILWRQDLSNSLAGRGGTIRLTSIPIQRTWGPTRYAVSESGRALGSIGPITPYGVIYQKVNELTCVDYLTGEPIWSRSGTDPGSDVFGDDQFVFVVPPDGDRAMVVRAADGTVLGERFVGVRRDRWVTSGRFVLLCQSSEGKLRIRWHDAWLAQDVWERVVDQSAQCWRPARDEVAVLEPSGKLMIVHLPDGRALVETQLEADPDLSRLYVHRSDTLYTVVACRREAAGAASPPRYFGALEADTAPEINGHIYAVDRRTGQPMWPRPAEVRQFRMPLDQPGESPALVLLNNYESKAAANSPRTAIAGQALCIDKRDGRQLLLDQGFGMIRTYSIETEPDLARVLVKTNTKQFMLQFTDEPISPELPVQIEQPPVPSDPLQQVGKIAEAILDAIVKPKSTGAKPAPAEQPRPEEPPQEGAAKKSQQE